MNVMQLFFASLFTPRQQEHEARQLLERADQARGQSANEAAELRNNALAMLRVVR